MFCVLLGCCLSETMIGVIIGSLSTLLCSCINGVISYAVNNRTHRNEVEERKRVEKKKEDDDAKKKREQIYLTFVNLYSFLCMFGSMRIAFNDNLFQWNNIVESVYKDDIKEIFRSFSRILNDVAMYGTIEMANKCRKFMETWNKKIFSYSECTTKDFQEMECALSSLIEDMKKELGVK